MCSGVCQHPDAEAHGCPSAAGLSSLSSTPWFVVSAVKSEIGMSSWEEIDNVDDAVGTRRAAFHMISMMRAHSADSRRGERI